MCFVNVQMSLSLAACLSITRQCCAVRHVIEAQVPYRAPFVRTASALSIWGTVNLVNALPARNAAFFTYVTSVSSFTAYTSPANQQLVRLEFVTEVPLDDHLSELLWHRTFCTRGHALSGPSSSMVA